MSGLLAQSKVHDVAPVIDRSGRGWISPPRGWRGYDRVVDFRTRIESYRVAWLATVLLSGCAAGKREPALDPAQTADPDVVDVGPYLGDGGFERRTFTRGSLSEPREPPQDYVLQRSETGREEGNLVGRARPPLKRYLKFDGAAGQPGRFAWPQGKQAWAAFFVEFDPPMTEWPGRISKHLPSTARSTLRTYDRYGNLLDANGSATRRVWYDGPAPIEIDGRRFDDCIRLRGVTSLFGQWVSVRLGEEVWLARDIGPIRRVEKISAHVLLLWRFQASYLYELQNAELATSREENAAKVNKSDVATSETGVETEKETTMRRPWRRLAIHLDRLVPHPRVGGLVVEWDEAGPALPEPPAE